MPALTSRTQSNVVGEIGACLSQTLLFDPLCLQANRTTQCKVPVGQVITAGASLFLWLALWALSVSPHLHERLHCDPVNPGHECILTLLNKGHVLSGQPAMFVPSASWVLVDLPQHSPAEPFSPPDFRLTPSRAPPAFSLDT